MSVLSPEERDVPYHCVNKLTEHVEEGGEWTRPLVRRKRGLNSFYVIFSYGVKHVEAIVYAMRRWGADCERGDDGVCAGCIQGVVNRAASRSEDSRSDLDHGIHHARPRLHDLRHAVRRGCQERGATGNGGHVYDLAGRSDL